MTEKEQEKHDLAQSVLAAKEELHLDVLLADPNGECAGLGALLNHQIEHLTAVSQEERDKLPVKKACIGCILRAAEYLTLRSASLIETGRDAASLHDLLAEEAEGDTGE